MNATVLSSVPATTSAQRRPHWRTVRCERAEPEGQLARGYRELARATRAVHREGAQMGADQAGRIDGAGTSGSNERFTEA